MALSPTAGAADSRPRRQHYRTPECDLIVRYRNAEASQDLIIPVHLVCNTPDDILIANVKANSALDRKWIGMTSAHDGVALLCGSGPSLADDLGLIDQMHARGRTIFAMNGAASFLASKGFWADFQVIVDAREQTAELIGPAKHHVFASQVHPALFEKKPEAELFHVDFCDKQDDFLDLLPGHDGEYALIPSHGSAGNVALHLAYVMGFREIHCFGYDSSYRGDASHAFRQDLNALEPVTTVEYGGKEYLCTFTMKAQADVFGRITPLLEELGCKIEVHGNGFLPDRWNAERAKTLEQREADKYRAMWERKEYRQWSPGLEHVDDAIRRLGMHPGDTLIDFGCGTGRATKEFIERGVEAVGIDIAPNALEEDVPFTLAALWDLPDYMAVWGFCCDVMEHIPPEKVDDVLSGIARSVVRGAYFAIDSDRDEMGVLIGQPLHLTVREPAWWRAMLEKHFADVDEQDGGVFVCRHAVST